VLGALARGHRVNAVAGREQHDRAGVVWLGIVWLGIAKVARPMPSQTVGEHRLAENPGLEAGTAISGDRDHDEPSHKH